MILLKIDAVRVAVRELERNTPRAVYVDCVPDGIETFQRVKVEARQVHFLDYGCNVQAIKADENAGPDPEIYPGALALPKSGELLAFERSDQIRM